MKKRYLFIPVFIFLAFVFFLSINCTKMAAKTLSSEDFTVNIGVGDVAYPRLVQSDNQGEYVLHFIVDFEGRKEQTSGAPIFKMVNEMYFYDDGHNKIVEPDEVNNVNNYSKYSYSFYDDNMPTYSELDTNPVSKIYFDISFVCINCGEDQEAYGYPYPTQNFSFELDVVYDIDVPVIDSSSWVLPSNEKLNNFNFKLYFSDNTSGIKEARYVFSYQQPTTIEDFTNTLTSGVEFSYIGERGNLINYAAVDGNVYLWTYIEDNAGHYTAKVFSYADESPYKYEFAPSENNLIYDQANSSIPSEDGIYKSIHVDLATSNTTYYIWNNQGYYTNALAIKTNGSLVPTTGIDFAPSATEGYYYLFLVSFSSETEYTSKVLKYHIDSVNPIIQEQHFPNNSYPYKNIEVSVTFTDVTSGLGEIYYSLSTDLIDDDHKDMVNIPYANGSTITVGEGLTGRYYLQFLAYDTIGNYSLGNIVYTFDNTPPNYALSVSEEAAANNPNYTSVRVSSVDVKDNSFRCGWFDSETVELSRVTDRCTTNTDIPLPKDGEGYVYLHMYLEDDLGNSVFTHSYRFTIDYVAPTLAYSVTYNDDEYHDNDMIYIQGHDTYGDIDAIKYLWRPYDDTSVKIINVSNTYDNHIDYPSNVYGEYGLWVYITDTLGNGALTKIDHKFLIDNEPYSIELLGKSKITILKNEKFFDPGVIAYKGSRNVGYLVTGVVNNRRVGTYTLTYYADTATITRTVIVKNNTMYYAIGLTLLFVGVTVSFIPSSLRKKKEI